MVDAYARSFGLRTMITRSSNNWGPRQHPEKFIPAAIIAKHTRKKMVVHGYDYLRDFIHVEDNVRAIYELTRQQKQGVWNVATGELVSLSEVLDRVGDVPHKVSPERPGVDEAYYVDADLTWDTLGWRPQSFMSDTRWERYLESPAVQSQTVR
jgi:dTDP-glucose 4,6-dehydratase